MCAFPFLESRSSERNRVTRSTPTYFRQTCGLLSNRDVRTVCSCQQSDFSTKSRHRQRGRSERPRYSSTAPSISLSLRGRRSASLIHSRPYIPIYMRINAPSTRVLNPEFYFYYHSLIIVHKNRYASSSRRKFMLQRELNLLFAEINLNLDISESEDKTRNKYYRS